MTIRDKDLKMLWGRAAGRCTAPMCNHIDLIPFLERTGRVVIGEMAHVIGRKAKAARANKDVGEDHNYGNLILLCPTCHTIVDGAPRDYPVKLLKAWKSEWEEQVASLDAQVRTRNELFQAIRQRLTENRTAHSEWGPESTRAIAFPENETAASAWKFRRLSVIVPNNRQIVGLLRANRKLLTAEEWSIATQFVEHVSLYERHCEDPVDKGAYMRFPGAFEQLIESRRQDG